MINKSDLISVLCVKGYRPTLDLIEQFCIVLILELPKDWIMPNKIQEYFFYLMLRMTWFSEKCKNKSS